MPRWCNASREGEGEGERGVSRRGWVVGGNAVWRASWFVGMAVTMLVTKAMKAEGGVEGFRRRVLSGLDACKINILWTLPLH